MKCLIVGVSGFLGRNVLSILTEKGFSGLALYNRGFSQVNNINHHFRFEHFDLGDPKLINESFDTLIYLAHGFLGKAKLPTSTDFYRNRILINLAGIFSVLSSGANTKSIIYSSSAFVYPWKSRENISEKTFPRPFSIYGMEKLVVEKFLEEFCEKNKIHLTILRFTQLYGPGDPHKQFITRMIEDAFFGREVHVEGKGEDARDILHVRDAAYAIYQVIERRSRGIFNISSGQTVDLETCGHLCLELAGRDPSELIYMPRKRKIIRISYSNKKAFNAFGFQPTILLKDGINECLMALKIQHAY